MSKILRETKPEIWASYAESQVFQAMGRNIQMQMLENGAMGVFNAFSEYLARYNDFNVGKIISDDVTDFLSEMQQKYNLDASEVSDLAGAILHMVNTIKQSYENRLKYLKKVQMQAAQTSTGPKPGDSSSMNPASQGTVTTEVVPTQAITSEGLIDINTPETDDGPKPKTSEKDLKDEPIPEKVELDSDTQSIAPATSEHNKTIYNDKHSEFVPATEGLDKTGIAPDAYQMAQLTYTELKDAGTFDFLNSGGVEVGDEIIFGIEEEFEKKKAEAITNKDSIYLQRPTVFIYKRLKDGSLQKIGDLFTNDDSRPANKAIREAVLEKFANREVGETEVYLEKKDATEDMQEFFDVSLVTGGIIKYTKEYAPISFDTTNARLGVITNNALVVNEKTVNGKVLVKPETLSASRGGLMILLPDIHRDYHPAFVSMPTLGEALKENPDKEVVKKVQDILSQIADIQNRTIFSVKVSEEKIPAEMEYLVKQLSKYLDFGRDLFIKYRNDERGPRILIGKYTREANGKKKTRTVTNAKGHSYQQFYADIISIPLDKGTVEERTTQLTNNISSALFYPKPEDIKKDNKGEYAQEFLSIARTNISEPRLGSVFFTTGKTFNGESVRNSKGSPKPADVVYKTINNYVESINNNDTLNTDIEYKDGAIIFEGDDTIFSENRPIAKTFTVFTKSFTSPRMALAYARALYFKDTQFMDSILHSSSIEEAEEKAKLVGKQSEWDKARHEAVILITMNVYDALEKGEQAVINAIGYSGDRIEDKSHTYKGSDSPALNWNLYYDHKANNIKLKYAAYFNRNGPKPGEEGQTSTFTQETGAVVDTTTPPEVKVTADKDPTVTGKPKDDSTDSEGSNEELEGEPTDDGVSNAALSIMEKVEESNGVTEGAETLTNEVSSEGKTTEDSNEEKGKGEEVGGSSLDDIFGTPDDDGSPFRLSPKYKIGEDFDFTKESKWVESKLGWDIQKQVIQTGTINSRNGEAQGYYDSRTGKIVLSNKATAYTLYHEAFHKLYREALHVKDKSLLLSFFSSSEFLNQKDNILSDVIDEVFKMDSEEIMAELFAQYIGADTYGKPEDKKRVILALKKIESLMKFSELVNAIESNKPIEYRTPYSEQNEAGLRKKNWLVRTFLKLVNAFRNRTKSYRTSDGYLPIKGLFDAINKGEFNKTKIEDNAEDALEREEAGNVDSTIHPNDEVLTTSDLVEGEVTEEELPDTEDRDLPKVDPELTEESEEEKLDSLMEEKEKEVIDDEDKQKYQLKNNIITRYSKELDDRLNMLPFEVRVPMWYIKNALDNYGKIGFLKAYHRNANAIMRDILNTTAKESNIGTAGSVAIQESLIEALRALKRNLKAAFPEHIETENIPDLDVNIIGNLTDIKVQRFLKNQNYKKTVNKIAGQIIAQLTAMEKAYVERVNQIKDDTSRTEALDIVERQKLCKNIFKR